MKERVLSMEEVTAMGEAIAETAAMIDAGIHRLLAQLREFDRVGGWHRHGALSCAHWLSWRVGVDLGAAREKVRVARKLAELPLIDEALRRGEISYSKVRAMTRVANGSNEAQLLETARHTTGAQLEKICRMTRQVQAFGTEAAKEIEDRRWVVTRGTDDGMVSIQVRLLPDEAARLMKAFEVCGGGNLADGAVAVAVADLALGGAGANVALGGAGAETTISGEGSEGGRRVRPPVEVVVHVDAETLEGTTELGDGISAATSRRLLCDAGVVPMLEERGRTIDVGRKTRTIPVGAEAGARGEGRRLPVPRLHEPAIRR